MFVVVARIMSRKGKVLVVSGKKVFVISLIIVDTNVQSYVACVMFSEISVPSSL